MTAINKTLRIGVCVFANVPELAELAGAPVDMGDLPGLAKAMEKHINLTGGVAGHGIEVDLYEMNPLTTDLASEETAAFESWVSGGDLYCAVAIHNGVTPTLPRLAGEAGIPLVSMAQGIADQTYLDEHPLFFSPITPHAGRWAAAYAEAVTRGDFLTGESTIGLLTVASDAFRRVRETVLKPALAAKGFTVSHDADADTSSLPALGAAMPGIVQGFKDAGVDRVLLLMDGFDFMRIAEEIDYHPRYALQSICATQLVQQIGHPAQFSGAMGIGWAPMFDVVAENDTVPDRAARVSAILADEGLKLQSRLAESLACVMADHLLFLQEATRDTVDTSPEGLVQAVERLGESFTSMSTFRTKFGPARHDGSDEVRVYKHDADHGFVYVGDPISLA